MKSYSSLSLLLVRLWQQIKPIRQFHLILLFCMMFITSIAEIISIGAIFPFLGALTSPKTVMTNEFLNSIFNSININNESQVLLPLTILFVSTLIISGIMRYALLWFQTKLSFSIGADLSFNMFNNVLYQPYRNHLESNSSEVISIVINKANDVTSQVLMPLLTILSSIIMILMIVGTIFVISPYVSIVSIIGFGFIYLIIIRITKSRLTSSSIIINRESIRVIKVLQESLGNIRDVIIDGSQKIYLNLFKSSDLSLRDAKASITIIGSSPRFGMEAFGMSMIAVVAYNISTSSQHNFSTNSIPILGSIALGAQRILPVLQLAFTSWTLIRGCKSSLEDALEILEMRVINEDSNDTSLNEFNFNYSINLENVCFSYNEDNKVLNEISLKIKKGSKIGIIGTTGSGKSTLLDIIMGLLNPTSGVLSIDDIVINPNNVKYWQKKIAHVPQSIYLSDCSIAENIAFGIEKSNIDYDLVRSSAKMAMISEIIESWNDKYNTIVGERGVKLSGGQRQRIAIARAFYKKAEVLILDEATSALDSDTESSVMDSIENFGTNLTIIIVAHRVTTLNKCDYIVKVVNGTILTDNL